MRFMIHLADLAAVAANRSEALVEVVADHGLLRHGGLDELTELADQLRQVCLLQSDLRVSGVSEDLSGQLSGSPRGDLDLLHALPDRVSRREVHLRQRRVAQHTDEKVVEVVGYAPSKHPETFQLLLMLDLGVELAARFP